MTGFALIVYGLYVAAVTYHDNLPELLAAIPDGKGYLLWILVIVILWALSKIPSIEPVVIGLSILIAAAYLLHTWPTIQSDGQNLLSEFGL